MEERHAKELHKQLSGKTVGNWVVGELLGYGGSAAVFDCSKDGENAAIKIIDPELIAEFGEDEQLSRIILEGRLANHNHPNLVRIISTGKCEATGHLYVAMERLDFRTIKDALMDFPANAIGPIIQQLASAAQWLESQGICHRDIKPSNVMVSTDFTRAVLMDLGIIYHFGDCVTTHSDSSGERFIGTARYCPGEFVRNRVEESAEGYRSITFYQIGCVLHDLICRKPIFAGHSKPYAVLLDAIDTLIPSIESDDVSPHLVLLARDCLRKSPIERNKLITWSRFDATPPAASINARERVRANLCAKGIGGTAGVTPPPLSMGLGRPELLGLGRHLRDELTAACDGNSELPLPIIDYDLVGGTLHVTAKFEANTTWEIHAPFVLVFAATQVLEEDYLFALDVAAFWDVVRIPTAFAEAGKSRVCIVRNRDQALRVEFEDVVYRALAGAMGHRPSSEAINFMIGE